MKAVKKFCVSIADCSEGHDNIKSVSFPVWAEDFDSARSVLLTLYPHLKNETYAIDYWWEAEKAGAV